MEYLDEYFLESAKAENIVQTTFLNKNRELVLIPYFRIELELEKNILLDFICTAFSG